LKKKLRLESKLTKFFPKKSSKCRNLIYDLAANSQNKRLYQSRSASVDLLSNDLKVGYLQ
jgi:hypothetical protein